MIILTKLLGGLLLSVVVFLIIFASPVEKVSVMKWKILSFFLIVAGIFTELFFSSVRPDWQTLKLNVVGFVLMTLGVIIGAVS